MSERLSRTGLRLRQTLFSEPPPVAPDLYSKLVALTGVRLLVGTALLAATFWLTLDSVDGFGRNAQGLLYGIIGSIYVGSLISIYFIRQGRYLREIAYAQLAGDVIAATGLVYLTGGADSIFTILYPLAIVNGSIGLSRRGGYIAGSWSAAAFLLLAVATERGWIPLPSYLERAPMATPRLVLTLAANLSAFLLTAALSGYLADALVGVRRELQGAESELRALSVLHENIVRSISSGILTIDGAQIITFLNPAGEEICGRSFEQLRGRPLRESFPDFAQALEQQARHLRGEGRLTHRDGTSRIVGYSLTPLVDVGTPSLPGFVVVFQDLTGLRRMEDAVRRSDRLAAVGQLAAGLAHEIRNPLASMSGSIEMLTSGSSLEEKDKRLMQIVLRESERLEVLVRDFLAFARPQQLERARVVLAAMAGELVEVFRQSAAQAGLRVFAELEPGLAVQGDEGQLRQVLWNLLRNAADATPSGGEVRVRVRALGKDAVLEVQDTGGGISAEDRARIFQPFFTTREHGSGLGLATVHRIVEAHGGRIDLESTPGHGSTFSVILPAAGS